MANSTNSLSHTKWLCKYHLLVSTLSKTRIASFMGYLKGKSVLMMFDKHAI